MIETAVVPTRNKERLARALTRAGECYMKKNVSTSRILLSPEKIQELSNVFERIIAHAQKLKWVKEE